MTVRALMLSWILACAMCMAVGAIGAELALPTPIRPVEGARNEFQSLQIDTPVFTRESIVEVSGRKYRKVEFKSHVVYMQLLDEEKAGSDLQLLCEAQGKEVFNSKSTPLLLAAVKVMRRSSLFIEGLKRVCADIEENQHAGLHGGKTITIDPRVYVGFLLRATDESRELLKNKRVFFDPNSRGAGFKADW